LSFRINKITRYPLILVFAIAGLASSQLYADDGIVYPDSAHVMFARDVSFDTVLVTITNLSSDSVHSFFLTDYTNLPAQSLECRVDGIIRDDLLIEHESGNVYPSRNTICWVIGGFESTVRLKYYSLSYIGNEISFSAGHPYPIFGIMPENGGQPPEPFPLIGPDNGTRQLDYYTSFIWGNTVDLDSNSSFTYTIQASRDSLFNTISNIGTGLTDTVITIATDSIGIVGSVYWRVLAIDNIGLVRVGGIPEGPSFMTILVPGDANSNGAANGLDVTFMVNYFKGGQAPDPILAGDANGNCHTNGVDVVYLVNYLKGVGNAPMRGDCISMAVAQPSPIIGPVDESILTPKETIDAAKTE
jgi:hypothetical protein